MKIRFPGTKTALMYFAIIAMSGISSGHAAPGALDGFWQTGEDNTVVEVSEANGVATGKVYSSENAKAVPGTAVLINFRESGETWQGTIYSISMDKELDATITPSGDSLAIKAKMGLITKNLTWTRDPGVQADNQ